MSKKVRFPKQDQDERKSTTRIAIFAGGMTVLIAATLAAFMWLKPTTDQTITAVDQSTTPPSPNVLLTISGSNTLGASLLPDLAEKYLKRLGASKIHRQQGPNPVEVDILGFIPGVEPPQVIRIQAHGSSTGFRSLANYTANIGAASRPITTQENQTLMAANFGNMTAPENEHVVALDGVAIIVNPANPLVSVSVENLGKVFSGQITNWSDLGGPDAPIQLYVRDIKSGTYDTFKSIVLGQQFTLSAWAKRFEDSHALYDAVMQDPRAIGFVGLPYVLSAKPLAVREYGSRAFLPRYETVKGEVYPLSRRLYLYTARYNRNPHVQSFLDLALSDTGQSLVRLANLVDLSLEKPAHFDTDNLTTDDTYRQLIEAAQLMVTIRFKSGADAPDTRAIDDLNRFIELMHRYPNRDKRIFLIGHSDGHGDPDLNRSLSLERAQTIMNQLNGKIENPIQAIGFGTAAPIADNRTEAGRMRNRRVEIFVSEGP